MKTRLILILFGLFVSLFTAEIAARFWTYYLEGRGRSVTERLKSSATTQLSGNSNNLRGLIRSSDIPDLVYELRPLTSGIFQDRPYQSNSFGARDSEYQVQKAENTVRIVGIGDSVMFGWGVNEQENYLSLIENNFGAHVLPPQHVEIINFATPGYNTAMEVTHLENKIMPFDPDIVVLHVVHNDLEVPIFMSKPHNIFSLTQSFLFRLLFGASSDAGNGSLVLANTASANDILDEYRHLVGIKAFRAALIKLGNLAHTHNFKVYVVYGRLPSEMRNVLTKVSKAQNFVLAPVKDAVDQILIEHNVPNDPKSRAVAIQVSPSDFHPNALGHEAYARALTAALITDAKIQEVVDWKALQY